MILDKLRSKLLDRQLKKARELSKTEHKRIESKIATVKRHEAKKNLLLREKLKLEMEKERLRTQIRKAKQLNLTPAEKKILEQRAKEKEQRINTIQKNTMTTLKFLGKTTLGIINFIASEEKPRKRTKKKGMKKKKMMMKYKKR